MAGLRAELAAASEREQAALRALEEARATIDALQAEAALLQDECRRLMKPCMFHVAVQSDIVSVNRAPMISSKLEQTEELTAVVVAPRDDMQLSGFYFEQQVDAPCPSLCGISGDSLFTGRATEEKMLTITSRDQQGEHRVNGGDIFSVYLSSDDVQVAARVVDCNDGSYTATYTVPRAGAYSMHVRLRTLTVHQQGLAHIIAGFDDVPIAGSPFAVEVLPGPACPRMCTASGPGLERGRAGFSSGFVVFTRDAAGSTVDAQLTTTCRFRESEPLNLQMEHLSGTGKYSYTFTPTRVGLHSIHIQVDGVSIASSPYLVSVEAGVVAPAMCRASGAGLHAASCGETATFEVKIFDAFGNPVDWGSSSIEAMISDASNSYASLTAQRIAGHDGRVEFAYQVVRAGEYRTNVWIGSREQQIFGSPFNLVVAPGRADPMCCVAQGAGLKRASIFTQASFQLLVRDSFSNAVDAADLRISVNSPLKENLGQPSPETRRLEQGLYEVNLPKRAGHYSVDVQVDGRNISNSPLSVIIEAGGAIATECTAEGTGLSQAMACSPAYFTIIARDMSASVTKLQPEPFEVRLCSMDGIRSRDGTVSCVGDGTYEVVYQVDHAGRYTMDVTLHGSPIAASPFIVHASPGFAVGFQSTAGGPGMRQITVGEACQITLHIRDFAGTLTDAARHNQSVLEAISLKLACDSLKSVWSKEELHASVFRLDTGVYVCTYIPTCPGNVAVDVEITVEGQQVHGRAESAIAAHCFSCRILLLAFLHFSHCA
jgi:hypothetical protein